MIIGFGNNVVSSLAADITASQTTIQVMPGAGAMFANLLTSDYANSSNPLKTYAKITLEDAKETVFEVCHLTAVNNDMLTVIRGQEGTTAKGWSLNDVIANFATRGSENQFVQIEELQSGHYVAGVAGGTENNLTLELPATYFVNGGADWTLRTPLVVIPALNNTGASTLQLTMGGRVLGIFPLYKGNKSELSASDIIKDVPVLCVLDNTKTYFSVLNPLEIYLGSRYLQKDQNLSDVPDKALARQSLQLGNSATLNVGTTANTVAAGDDSRITGAMQKDQNGADIPDKPGFIKNVGAVDANGGDYNNFFNFKQVGTIPVDANPNYLVSADVTATGGLVAWLQNQWHGNTVKWGAVRGAGADLRCAGIEINGALIFKLFADGTINAHGKDMASQEWANSQFPLKIDLGNASTKTVGTGANQIPDMNSFQSGTNRFGTWMRLPSGIMIQLGLYPASGPTGGISFPTPFTSSPSYSLSPTGVSGIMAVSSGASLTGINDVKTFDAAGNILANGVSWIAIGR